MADIWHSNNPDVGCIDLDEIRSMTRSGGNKIAIIKKLREVGNMGLKDAKNIVDKYNYDAEGLVCEFKKFCAPKTITKEQYLNMINNAIDNMDAFYCHDMNEAILTLATNIKNKGGLEQVALEYERFIDMI